MRRILILFFLTGCTHYRYMEPQYFSGEQHPEKIKFASCTDYILGISTDEENITYAKSLANAKVSPNQVFTVDYKIWAWFWPFYAWRCLEINVNDTYVVSKASYNFKQSVPNAAESTTSNQSNTTPPTQAEPNVVTGSLPNDLSACDKLSKKKAAACKKLILRQYEGLEKIK